MWKAVAVMSKGEEAFSCIDEKDRAVSRTRAYFAGAGFVRPLQAVWNRYSRMEQARGTAVVKNARPEEFEVMNAFMGKRDISVGDLRISLAEFERELLESAFPFTIAELHEVLTGDPLLTKADRRLLAEQAWQDLFAAVERQLTEEGIRFYPIVSEWLSGMKRGVSAGYRTLRELWRSAPEIAERELGDAVRAWQLLLKGEVGRLLGSSELTEVRLPVLAAAATGNPHALDRNAPAGRLFFHALHSSFSGQQSAGADTVEAAAAVQAASGLDSLAIRMIYRSSGILDDDISSIVHIWYYRGSSSAFPSVMTLRQVENTTAWPPVGDIYIVENPAVFSTLVDVAGAMPHRGDTAGNQAGVCPLLVCTSGPASAAALSLLDGYLKKEQTGRSLYYSGDFDIKGIEIGNVLAARYGAHFVPWHFDAMSYTLGCRDVRAGLFFSQEELLRLGKMAALWDTTLCEALSLKRNKLFQEQLILPLVEDWKRVLRGGE